MGVVFFGGGAFGLPTLERLAGQGRVRAIVTQPDRPAGRGKRPTPTPIADWAETHRPDVPVLKPEKVNEAGTVERIRGFDADAWVVIAFGQKLGRALLADRFAINLHASLLPRWRGAAPIHAAVLAGDAETGNSVITLADRMDAGEVLAQSRRPITPELTTGQLHDLLSGDGPSLIERVLASRAAGTLEPRTQDESLVTLAPKLSRADGVLDFAEEADALRRRVHAMTPWPGASGLLGGERLKILRVETVAGPDPTPGGDAPGALVDPRKGILVCGRGSRLRLVEVQPAGGKAMAWRAFAAGRTLGPGARLERAE